MDEVLEATLRMALTAAGRLAELAARDYERAARSQQAVTEAEVQHLQARLVAERSAARVEPPPVRSNGFATQDHVLAATHQARPAIATVETLANGGASQSQRLIPLSGERRNWALRRGPRTAMGQALASDE
ncbi:hypothetical protein [Aquipuribacter hungaricus]|uniref:Uncharacterized protein n=1 Tax=Aquipuribacter hungaricus TaxID=545624 RepID=A0ABV7WN95_9MICO